MVAVRKSGNHRQILKPLAAYLPIRKRGCSIQSLRHLLRLTMRVEVSGKGENEESWRSEVIVGRSILIASLTSAGSQK